MIDNPTTGKDKSQRKETKKEEGRDGKVAYHIIIRGKAFCSLKIRLAFRLQNKNHL